MAFHVMAKPNGALCNMKCFYCFFLSKQKTLHSKQAMSSAVLEDFIRCYIDSQPSGLVVFTWQGGEPTLLGIPFFQRILDLQQKYCTPDKTIANDLQTNGLLLDKKWCEFLKANNFLVGLSLDGQEELHDCYRKKNSGQGSFSTVMKAVNLLLHYNIPFNTITVLHRKNAKKPLELYRFLRDEVGSVCMQFLPLVETVEYIETAHGYWPALMLPKIGSPASLPGNEGSFIMEWSVEPDDFGQFLCQIFDEWKAHDIGKITIPVFECMLSIWAGLGASMCLFSPKCGQNIALDSDGSLYFCDRFCYKSYKLGTLAENSLKTIMQSNDLRLWSNLKAAVSPQCRDCRWLFACRGECPKNRFLLDANGHMGHNYLCRGLQYFFEHIDTSMVEMANILKNGDKNNMEAS